MRTHDHGLSKASSATCSARRRARRRSRHRHLPATAPQAGPASRPPPPGGNRPRLGRDRPRVDRRLGGRAQRGAAWRGTTRSRPATTRSSSGRPRSRRSRSEAHPDWYLVNEWPLSMLIAVEGSGSVLGRVHRCCAGCAASRRRCARAANPRSSANRFPYGLPMFQLSNVDMGLDAVSCGQDLPGERRRPLRGLDYQRADLRGEGPVDPGVPMPGIGLPPAGDGGPCGAGSIRELHGER